MQIQITPTEPRTIDDADLAVRIHPDYKRKTLTVKIPRSFAALEGEITQAAALISPSGDLHNDAVSLAELIRDRVFRRAKIVQPGSTYTWEVIADPGATSPAITIYDDFGGPDVTVRVEPYHAVTLQRYFNDHEDLFAAAKRRGEGDPKAAFGAIIAEILAHFGAGGAKVQTM